MNYIVLDKVHICIIIILHLGIWPRRPISQCWAHILIIINGVNAMHICTVAHCTRLGTVLLPSITLNANTSYQSYQ